MGLRDKYRAGRSKIVPYLPGESPSQRHERRKVSAEKNEQWLREVLCELGVTLTVHNEGHHWKMVSESMVAEWWPSSAKLVFNKKYHLGNHCHDHEQVAAKIAWYLELQARKQS